MAASAQETLKEGPLDKLGHFVKNWKNRFFVLETRINANGTSTEPFLVYYRGSGVGMSAGPKGQLCLVGAQVLRPAHDDPNDKYFNFEISSSDGKNGIKLRATTSEIRSEWVAAIDAAIGATAPETEILDTMKGTMEKGTVRQLSAAPASVFKTRYFELEKRVSKSLGAEIFFVYYLDSQKQEAPKGTISLIDASATRPDRDDPSNPYFVFTLLFSDGRAMDCRCKTGAERDKWCEAIEKAAAMSAAVVVEPEKTSTETQETAASTAAGASEAETSQTETSQERTQVEGKGPEENSSPPQVEE